MSKHQAIIIRTGIPVIIGTIIFFGGFWIWDRLTAPAYIESCNDYRLSNFFYLISILVTAGISTFYQLTVGKWLKERVIHNKAAGHVINIVAFALFLTGIMLVVSIIDGKPGNGIGTYFLLTIVLGIITEVFLLINPLKLINPS